jgi:hypothetical protein
MALLYSALNHCATQPTQETRLHFFQIIIGRIMQP